MATDGAFHRSLRSFRLLPSMGARPASGRPGGGPMP